MIMSGQNAAQGGGKLACGTRTRNLLFLTEELYPLSQCAMLGDKTAMRFYPLVRAAGLEPTVSWSQTRRDTKLR